MATWAYLSKFIGIYESPVFNFSLDGDGGLSTITWEHETPEGTEIIIQVSTSYDSGISWEDWLPATNGGSIPYITSDVDMHDFYFKFRAIFKTSTASLTPLLNGVNFEIEPIINFNNEGDKEIYPEVFIDKIGNGDISIINTSYGNYEFKFTDIIDEERLYINGEREQIETNLPFVYRYANFNDNYLKFVEGENVLRVKGNGKIQFRYELKYVHGF